MSDLSSRIAPDNQPGMESNATSLFRSASSDNAFPMAQRLGMSFLGLSLSAAKVDTAAKRFRKQIFLSVDLPASVVGFGQGQELVFEAERGIVEALKALEKS